MRKFIDIVEWAEDDDIWEPKYYTLARGTRVYHGTDDEEFELFQGIWVSNDRHVAERFARGGQVHEFIVNTDHQLPLIESKQEFDDFCQQYDISDYGAEDMRDDAIRAKISGWIIPNNYGPGAADILIIDSSILTPA